mmetsp:Transcript_4242/g.11967  ORF Transcript_4242/g.11967 Transcript_4242/m.11967 type:complete len:206 (-) Transcript_4242:1401-2018(-)
MNPKGMAVTGQPPVMTSVEMAYAAGRPLRLASDLPKPARPCARACFLASSSLASSLTSCKSSGGQVASLFLSCLTKAGGSLAMRVRLRHLSFRSTALRFSMAANESFLISAHLPPPHFRTPSTSALVSASDQNLYPVPFPSPAGDSSSLDPPSWTEAFVGHAAGLKDLCFLFDPSTEEELLFTPDAPFVSAEPEGVASGQTAPAC